MIPNRTGELIANRYMVEKPLGQGTRGDVYLCEDLNLLRPVAVKVIRPEFVDNQEVRSWFREEGFAQASIGVHPNIATLFDMVQQDGCPHLVMEFVEGETLYDWLVKTSPTGIQLAQAVEIIKQILTGMDYINSRWVKYPCIHDKDVIIQQSGRIKIVDFGQEKGTPTKPAPYLKSVAHILFRLLAGMPKPNYFPAVPRNAVEVIRTATSDDLSERFTSSQDFITALEEIM